MLKPPLYQMDPEWEGNIPPLGHHLKHVPQDQTSSPVRVRSQTKHFLTQQRFLLETPSEGDAMYHTLKGSFIFEWINTSNEIRVYCGRHRPGSTEKRDRGTQEGCFSVTGNTLLEENIGQSRQMMSSHVSQLWWCKVKTQLLIHSASFWRIISGLLYCGLEAWPWKQKLT